MNQDDRAAFDRALRPARLSAYPPGEFAGQESFMRASEILSLATRAGVGPGTAVLDLCCGVAGPGRLIARELGCAYRGVDSSAAAVAIARDRAGELPCRFEVAPIPPVPPGPYDVVLLLETMLAFRDKATLLREISAVLRVGGRFAFTVEEGQPLSEAERASMPDADTVWPVPLPEMLSYLDRFGLRVRWRAECTRCHLTIADSLASAFATHAPDIARRLGRAALDDLLTAHRYWSAWLREGRIRKFAFVTERAR